MLRGMSAIQWAHWKVHMQLSPFGEEAENIRTAVIAQAIWNVEIAKAQGAWDASKRKRGERPKMRELHEFILRFGDAPDPTPAKKPMTGRERFQNLKERFEALGFKPVKRNVT